MKRTQKSISMASLAEIFLPYVNADDIDDPMALANAFQLILRGLIKDNKHFANHCYEFTFGNENHFGYWSDYVFEQVKKHLELDKMPITIKNEDQDE